MIAMTTSNSIKVKPRCPEDDRGEAMGRAPQGTRLRERSGETIVAGKLARPSAGRAKLKCDTHSSHERYLTRYSKTSMVFHENTRINHNFGHVVFLLQLRVDLSDVYCVTVAPRDSHAVGWRRRFIIRSNPITTSIEIPATGSIAAQAPMRPQPHQGRERARGLRGKPERP